MQGSQVPALVRGSRAPALSRPQQEDLRTSYVAAGVHFLGMYIISYTQRKPDSERQHALRFGGTPNQLGHLRALHLPRNPAAPAVAP